MEPSTEHTELLREIRDGQRELLALTKLWMERADKQYQDWQRSQAEYEARIEREQPLVKRWDEANELWLRQQRRAKRVTVVVTALGAVGAAVAGILAATGCFN
jgi:hypothetical protein